MPIEDDELDLVADSLAAAGFAVDVAEWADTDVDWSESDAVLIRSPWDYFRRLPEFLKWADAVSHVARVWNPVQIVRWNSHKQYLLDLSEAGVPIVPTELVRRGTQASLAELLERRGWESVVVKPAVNAGGFDTHRTDADAGQGHLDSLAATGDVLVQRYIDSVEAAGELTLVFIEGTLTHAVRKLPESGEFRTQVEYGATATPVEPSPDAIDVAQRTFAALGTPPLYARIDMIEDATGTETRPLLIEVELIEPHLFLTDAPDGGERALGALADGILRRLATGAV